MPNWHFAALWATVELLWNKEVCVEQKHLVSHCWVSSAKTLSLSSFPSPGATLLCKRTEDICVVGASAAFLTICLYYYNCFYSDLFLYISPSYFVCQDCWWRPTATPNITPRCLSSVGHIWQWNSLYLSLWSVTQCLTSGHQLKSVERIPYL